jgi:hypothetical protein
MEEVDVSLYPPDGQLKVVQRVEVKVVVEVMRYLWSWLRHLVLPLYVSGPRYQLGSVGRFASRLVGGTVPRLVARITGIGLMTRRLPQ